MLPSTTEQADAPPPGAIVIQVGPGAVFTPDEITAPAAGTFTVFLDLSQADEGIHHNFKIGRQLPPELPLAESETFEHGESVTFTVTGLEPGTYRFWCSIDEHYNLGMEGTLVLEG